MAVIDTIKNVISFFTLKSEERVNRMYMENPDILRKKLESDKYAQVESLYDTAEQLQTFKQQWTSKIDLLNQEVNCLVGKINAAKEKGDMAAAQQQAAVWQSKNRILTGYNIGLEKVSKRYDEVCARTREIVSLYDSKIQEVECVISEYLVNKELMKANALVGEHIVPTPEIKINGIMKSIEEANDKLNAKMKVMEDLAPEAAKHDPETTGADALEEFNRTFGH